MLTGNARLVVSKLLGAGTQLRFLPRAWGLVWNASGRITIVWLLLLLVQGLLPVVVVYLTRDLIDSLAVAVKGGCPQLDCPYIAPIVTLAVAMGATLLVSEFVRSAANWIKARQAKEVEDYISALVYAKSTEVDLGFYESPDFHDHLHRARAEASHRPVALLENSGSFIQNAITLGAMTIVLIPYGAWMALALLLSTVPALAIVLRYAVKQHRWQRQITADERRVYYYDWLMTDPQPAAELRLFGLGASFQEASRALRARLRAGSLRLAWSRSIAEFLAATVALVVAAACMGVMLWRAFLGQATLGDLALFYQAFSQGQRLMRTMLDSVGQIYYNILFLGNLFEFLDLKSNLSDSASSAGSVVVRGSDPVEVRLTDVTFSYPGSSRIALKDMDVVFPAGRITAIVGANGAGKSTVLKLLCRFYDPQEGRVEINRTDIRSLDIGVLRRMITVLFQQPVHYNASVSENVLLRPPLAHDQPQVTAAARAAGVDDLVRRLPEGYETLLGKWFAGGIELSTGEWQRIALARAFLREAAIIVLDEPTSAMDSWAETEWLTRFRALAHGRTSIVITHRFTTAMQADIIHVMGEGGIIESGSHGELLERNGRYAESWRAQMRAADREVSLQN